METYFDHYRPASVYPGYHDPVFALNGFGYGFCDDNAGIVVEIARAAGLEARVWLLGGHVVPEVELGDGRQVIVDADLGHFLPYGVEELAANRSLAGPEPSEYYDWMWSYYGSTEDNRIDKERPADPWTARVSLPPGGWWELSYAPSSLWVVDGEVRNQTDRVATIEDWPFRVHGYPEDDPYHIPPRYDVGMGRTSESETWPWVPMGPDEDGAHRFPFNPRVLPAIEAGENGWVVVVEGVP